MSSRIAPDAPSAVARPKAPPASGGPKPRSAAAWREDRWADASATPCALTPFVPVAGSVVEDVAAAREALLAQWHLPIAPPGQSGHSWQVRAMLAYVRDRLSTDACWQRIEVFVGGSYPNFRMQVPWQRRIPRDVDPLFRVARAQSASFSDLERQVRAALGHVLQTDPAQPEAQKPYLSSRMEPSVDGHDALLCVRVGAGHAHADLRFIFADQHFSAYDFRCNALLVDAFDSQHWTVLQGPRAEDVMDDIAQGIYTADHALRHTGVLRASKMRAMGLVPATPEQDAALWQSLLEHVTAGGPDDLLGVGLRLNAVFSNEMSRAYLGVTQAQDAGAILANALVGLHAQLHLPEARAVYAQLHVALGRVLARCAPSPALTALVDILSRPELLAHVGLYMHALAAAPSRASSIVAPQARWPVEHAAHLASGHVRYFCAALDSFVCFPIPAPADMPPMGALHAARCAPVLPQAAAQLAWLVEIPALADLLCEAAPADADRCRQLGLRLGQLAGDYDAHAPSTAHRLGLAALAFSPRAPLPRPVLACVMSTNHTPLSRSILTAYHKDAAEQAVHRLHARAAAADAPLAKDGDWLALSDACSFFAAKQASAGAEVAAWRTLCQRAVIAAARLAPDSPLPHALLAELVVQGSEAPATQTPQWLASCLHLRAQCDDSRAHASLRGALRSPVRQLQVLLEAATDSSASACAREALQWPCPPCSRLKRLAHCLALVPQLASEMDTSDAFGVACSVAVRCTWPNQHAVRLCLARLCAEPRLVRRLCRDTARLQALMAQNDLRAAVLDALEAAHINDPAVLRLVLTAYLVDGLAPAAVGGWLGRCWPSEMVRQEMGQRIASAPQPQALLQLWLRTLATAALGGGPLSVAPLFANVLSRLSVLYMGQEHARFAAVSIGHVRAWCAWAPLPQNASPHARMGLARLYLIVSSPNDAMAVLQPMCLQALSDGARYPGFLQLMQHAAEQIAHRPHGRSAQRLKAIARDYIDTPCLDRAHLPHVGQAVRALSFALSQQGAHRLAGDLVWHAFARWEQRSIVWAFGAGPLWGTPDDLCWAQMLQRNLQDAERQIVFVQLADRTARATLTAWTDAQHEAIYPKPPGASLREGLAAAWSMLQARGQHFALRQHDRVFESLVHALQHNDIEASFVSYLDTLTTPVDYDDLQSLGGLWQAWLHAAPDAATHSERQVRILHRMGLTQNATLADGWPADSDARRKLGAALAALLPSLCGDQQSAHVKLATWNQIVAMLLHNRPQMAWLDAALSCSVETPGRLHKRLEVHMLMRLRALRKDAAHPDEAAELGIVILHYALAMGGHPENDICARATLIEQVLQIMQTALVHPYLNWLSSVAIFWDISAPHVRACMPTVARLREHFAAAEAQKRLVPHADGMQMLSEESLEYFLNAEGLEHLKHGVMFLGESNKDRLMQWSSADPWRLALMFGFRHSAWYEAVLDPFASCNVMSAGPQYAYLLAVVIDGLWDTGHLRYGPMMPVIRIVARLWRNPALRPGLEAALDKLTRFCQHHQIDDALDTVVALRQAEAAHRLSARGAQMMQRLVDALSLSDAAARTATMHTQVLKMQPPHAG